MSISSNNKKMNVPDSFKMVNDREKIFERLDFLSSEIADVFMQVSLTGKILYISQSCETLTGFKPKDVVGKRFTLFAPKKEWPKYFKKLKLMIEGKIVTNFDTYVLKKDGSILPVEFSGYSSKKGRYFNAIMRDISKRKNIDNRYKLLFEHSECPITYLDLSGNILLINYYGARNLKLKKDKSIGQSIFDLLPDFAEEQKKRFDKITKSGKGLLKEDMIKLPDNTFKWFYSNLQPIEDEKNNIIGIQIVSIDITDLKNTAIQLKESEEKFRALSEKSPNMIFINRGGKLVFVNNKFVDIMGYSKKEFLSNDFDFMNLIAPESKKEIRESFKKHLSGIEIPPYESKIITKNKKKIEIIINTKLIDFEKEKSILGIITDVTELKKIEKEKKETGDYLQNIIDNTSEIIITVDREFSINTWNKTAEKIIGYRRKDVKNKKIHKIDLFEFNSEIRNFVENILNKKPVILNEINVKTAFGHYITLSVSYSIITDQFDNIKEIIFICKDITYEIEYKKKVLSGHSYIIDNTDIKTSLRLFHELIKDKKGIYIGRNIDEKLLNHEIKKEIIIYELSENINNELPIVNNLNDLIKIIEKNVYKNERIILFDRIDYLITTYTFEEVLKFLYIINDIIKKYKSILIIRINSDFLNEKQLSTLNEEFEKIPSKSISDVIIDDELLDIIKYIHNENTMNINVTYGNIGKMFNISKVTVKKRIETLIGKQLVYSRKIGKTKLLYLTDEGRNILSKKN